MLDTKKTILLFALMLVTIMGLSAVTAGNMDNITETSTNDNIQELSMEKSTYDMPEKKQTDTIKEAGVKTITNETYTSYFTNTSSFIPKSTSRISQGDTIDLQGTFTNMSFVVDKSNITFTSINRDAKLYNCTVYVQSEAVGSVISNMDIYNINKEHTTGIFVNESKNLIVEDNHVIVDDCSYSFAFAGSLNNSIIRSNYFETLSTTTARTHTSCVLGKSYYNTITNNTVRSDEADGIYFSSYASGRFIMAGPCSYNNITYNNVSGGDGIWVNLIQTSGTNNNILYNNVTGGYEGIVVLGGNAVIGNNKITGPKQYGIDVQSDATITNNNITVTDTSVGVRLFKNVKITDNNINSENAYALYIESGEDCANFNITQNNMTSTNSTGIYTKGIANHIIIENNQINTKDEGINFGQQSLTKRANNILVNNNNITAQADYAINFAYAGSRTASNINITVTDTNILTSLRGTGLHTSYLPPSNNKNITQIRTQLILEGIEASYGMPTNITATITAMDKSTVNEGNVTFTTSSGEQIATAPVINNQSTITSSFIDLNVNQITATFEQTENYTASHNTTSISINMDNLLETIQALVEENNMLKQNLKNNQTRINELTTENGELLEQIQQLQNQNEEVQQENMQLTQQITQYNSTIQLQQDLINNQSRTIQAQEGMINNQSVVIGTLQSTVDNQSQIIQNQQDIIDNFNRTINNQQETIQTQQSEIYSLNAKINQTTTENMEILLNTIENLTTNLNEANSTIQEQNTQINVLNTTINNLTGENTQLKISINEYQNEKINQKAMIEDLSNQLDDAGIVIDRQSNLVDQLNTTVRKQNLQIASLEYNLTQYQNETANQKAMIEDLSNQLDDAGIVIDRQSVLVDQLNTTLHNQNSQINALTNDINTQNNKINDLNSKLANANNVNIEQKQKISQLNQIINQLNETIKEFTETQKTKLTINKIAQTKYSNYIKITGNLTDNKGTGLKNQIIIIKINNKENKVITNNKGTYTYKHKTDKTGTNNITVIYEATDKYNKNNINTTFNVEKQGLNIKINSIQKVKYGNNVTIKGTFTDDNKKGLMNTVLKVNINGKTVNIKTTLNGTFTYTAPTNTTGTNKLRISYPGNKNYNSITQKTTFQVIKQDTTIKINPIIPVKYDDNITITGTLLDVNGRKIQNTQITIRINSKIYMAKTDKNGNYNLTTKTTQTGTNNLTVSYAGNNNYNKNSIKTTFKVNKQDIKMNIEKINTTNNKITVQGIVTDINDNIIIDNIKITLNNKTKSVKTNTHGRYTYTQKINQKEFKLTFTYNGNVKYNKYNKTISVKTG